MFHCNGIYQVNQHLCSLAFQTQRVRCVDHPCLCILSSFADRLSCSVTCADGVYICNVVAKAWHNTACAPGDSLTSNSGVHSLLKPGQTLLHVHQAMFTTRSGDLVCLECPLLRSLRSSGRCQLLP